MRVYVTSGSRNKKTHTHKDTRETERSGPNLEPGTMRVYVANSSRNGLNIGRKVGPCPGTRRRWVLGSVQASSQAIHAAITDRPRFEVKARPSYMYVWSIGLKVLCVPK